VEAEVGRAAQFEGDRAPVAGDAQVLGRQIGDLGLGRRGVHLVLAELASLRDIALSWGRDGSLLPLCRENNRLNGHLFSQTRLGRRFNGQADDEITVFRR